jgi:hypothetical protein
MVGFTISIISATSIVFVLNIIVTKKRGVHITHSTPTVANKPCRLDSTDLLYLAQNSNPITQQLLIGPFLYTS